MSWFSEFLHPGRGYKDAQKDLDKYYNQGQGYLDPYNQNGQDQYKNLQEMIDKLKNPAALRDEWEKSYKESDAAKNAESAATQHGLDAASSLGLNGSSSALSAIQAGTSGIAAEDKQNYLNDLMEKYMGATGLASGVYGTGAGAAGQQSTNSMNQGANTAQLTFGRKNAGGSRFGNMFGQGVGLFGSYLGGRK